MTRKTHLLTLCFALFAFPGIAFLQAEDKLGPNTLTKKEEASRWKLLFNGKDTSQLRGFKTGALSDKWQVKDGAASFNRLVSEYLRFGPFELFSVTR